MVLNIWNYTKKPYEMKSRQILAKSWIFSVPFLVSSLQSGSSPSFSSLLVLTSYLSNSEFPSLEPKNIKLLSNLAKVVETDDDDALC